MIKKGTPRTIVCLTVTLVALFMFPIQFVKSSFIDTAHASVASVLSQDGNVVVDIAKNKTPAVVNVSVRLKPEKTQFKPNAPKFPENWPLFRKSPKSTALYPRSDQIWEMRSNQISPDFGDEI